MNTRGKRPIIWVLAIALTLGVAIVRHWSNVPLDELALFFPERVEIISEPEPVRKFTVRLETPPPKIQEPEPKPEKESDPEKALKPDRAEGAYFTTSLNYRSQLGFSSYVELIKGMGGRFFLYDKSNRKVVAELDMIEPELRKPGSLASLSPRSRVITGELITDEYEREADRLFGQGSYQVIFLWPATVEDKFQYEIQAQLSTLNLDQSRIVELKGNYQEVNGVVQMVFQQAVLSGGDIESVHIVIEV